ncbi:hypothetical protein ONE63_004814 [Megalurothrips usitatus]|uniref:Uncharacterized protein n=1 Tax=Megalurothrips usitatus TaxID=439358 RepID=A0AAV7X0W1_9NEOP|nr:hypothetical protein ONE63_004814 [Megalurothrips usitatus]
MLKFLTNKLKNHSLNEDKSSVDKADDIHDSGTESDDENAHREDSDTNMECEVDRWSGSTISPLPDTITASGSATPASPYFLDSALPSDSDLNYDHHSSEEELEVINCTIPQEPRQPPPRSQSASTLPEKRKWSQVTRSVTPLDDSPAGEILIPPSSGSSGDEEVQGLLAAMATPVRFRTSPPRDAHKPGQRSFSPPLKLFHLDVSPRKRHRQSTRPHHIQRPCLDFEKMQQMKARAVTSWRHTGEHGSELSVYCW